LVFPRWFEFLEDPQQVEGALEAALAAGLGGHGALQSPVGGAEELDRQVHRAPPLDRPTLAGERAEGYGRTFQSTFQSTYDLDNTLRAQVLLGTRMPAEQ